MKPHTLAAFYLGFSIGTLFGIGLTVGLTPAHSQTVQPPVSVALSGPWEANTDGRFYSTEPPTRFLCNYQGDLKIVPTAPERMTAVCTGLDGSTLSEEVYACSTFDDLRTWCSIYVPTGLPLNSTMFRHELAHCCGWPVNHPN